ncbi:MAG TPA: ClC family H(+)/Cl(-) exchange transporter [Acetivibrio sp.]|uniref:ClC family H(+)/Cl(-) exchange transporter n=1 Tax=Acetivibrio sp. TaxID=1872092 RepID=UPI002CA26AC9|nr:ClC family H(+)/Cl(-) exchange transporter [Acetivibrio sp.]HOM01522.1 ClC family H(+)/Cl(-) exchange transporter [Acetivibrio sp.]
MKRLKKNSTANTLSKWYDFRLKIIIEGIIVGAIAGIVVVLYRFLLEKALGFSKHMYMLQSKHYWMIPLWIVGLIISGWIVGILVNKEPMISGSGIPQVEGVLLQKLKMNWWKVILGKFAGGLLSICAGLSLGREGPSIQIGAAAGQGFSRLFKRIKLEEKYLITCGASAGLASAFNAPFAGVIFALEEMHKSFSPVVMTSALAASLTADFVSKEFFGLKPVFDFKQVSTIPLNNYLFLLVLGVVVGLLGIVFNKTIFITQDIYAKQKWLPSEVKPVIAFLVAAIVGLIMPEVLGGGSEIIVSLSTVSFPLITLFVILIVKFLFTMISYGSSAPGGIFMPLLVIGALIGVIYGNIVNSLFGFSQTYIPSLIIFAMAGYFSATVKAPITGCILITEMTGSFSHLLSIGLVCLTAYIVADVLNSKPIYEVLLERLSNNANNAFIGEEDNKIIIETPIVMGSLLEGKKIKEVEWPANCLIVGVKRGEVELIPNGDTKLVSGDYLIVLSNENDAPDVKECLSKAGQNLAFI